MGLNPNSDASACNSCSQGKPSMCMGCFFFPLSNSISSSMSVCAFVNDSDLKSTYSMCFGTFVYAYLCKELLVCVWWYYFVVYSCRPALTIVEYHFDKPCKETNFFCTSWHIYCFSKALHKLYIISCIFYLPYWIGRNKYFMLYCKAKKKKTMARMTVETEAACSLF